MDIYDGKNASSPMIVGRLCGSSTPRSIISTGNEFFIRIYSYSDLKNAGFKLKVEEKGKIRHAVIENKLSLYIYCKS